jgi:hypothetical protein
LEDLVVDKQESQDYAQLNVQVEPTEPKSPPPPPAARDRRVAMLICHGMGQQVQFETLDAVVREVRETALRCGTLVPKEQTVGVSLHANEGSFVARAELNLQHQNKSRREVHFYEAYWAPLTEGRVTLRETLTFLREAGRRGMWFALRDGVFDRWMFGGREEFQIPPRRVLQLGLGLWMIVLIAAAITATGLLPLMKLLDVFRVGHTGPQIAVTAAVAFSIGIFLGLFGAGAVLIAWLLGSSADINRPKAVIDAPIGIMASPMWQRVGMALLLVGSILVTGGLTVAIGIGLYRKWILPAVTDSAAHQVVVIVLILLFVVQTVLLRRFVKNFLVEFAGDVAAYVSPYKVSKFEEIRRAIQERGRQAAKFIYSARESGSLLYDEVFVVGHSLGSVLAYDTLNDAIKRDTHEHGWGNDAPTGGYRVVDRTKLLLTFGSPLDKTAFVFRTQKTEREIDVREALAGAQQPLILNYAMRCAHWINLWSPSDWISGSLGYYDAPQPRPGQGVCNIQNPGSKLPPIAHTDYWSGPLFRGVLHTALTGICPDDVIEPQRGQVIGCLRDDAIRSV